ncbi:hypothetical protein AB6A40_006361 [Gnathostoma spinigerum]|uniref:diacylglycerol O-acyltransferase n=1 Tax=Gnathostoma spinigerum TaxID=75299 RepID=A0ABD6ESJ5_9BILA
MDESVKLRRRIPSNSDELRPRLGSISSVGSSVQHLWTSRPDRPLHVAQASLFTASSGWTNYKGFFNLAILLLFLSNARVALENLMKYGILISPLQWLYFVTTDPWNCPYLLLALLSNITVLASLFIEKMIARRWLPELIAAAIYIAILSVHITFPVIVTVIVQVYLSLIPHENFTAISTAAC